MSRTGRERQGDNANDDVESSSSSSSESESDGEDEGGTEAPEEAGPNQLSLIDDDVCNLLIQSAMQPEGGESCDGHVMGRCRSMILTVMW